MSESPAVESHSSFAAVGAPDGESWRIQLSGEFDVAGMQAAHAALDEALATDGVGVVIDLAGLTFMDSSGLRFLIAAKDRCEAERRPLTLRRGGPAIQRILQLTRLDSVLPFAD